MPTPDPKAPPADPYDADSRSPGLRVGDIRKAIAGLPDDHEVCVRVNTDEICSFAGGIISTSIDYAHDENDTPFLALDCSDQLEDFDDHDT